jgi:hypothetical protein
VEFTEKLAHATTGNFQTNTDGFSAYRDAISYSLGARYVDFAVIAKEYKSTPESETRYSPSECMSCKKVAVYGRPDLDAASTSHIERQNLTARMSMHRLTRLTNAFSKRWRNLRAAYALHFAYYNSCRIHSALRVTPAMESGIADHQWDLSELVTVG